MRGKYKVKKLKQLWLFLAMTGIMTVLAGCGQKETMSTGEQTQAEASDAVNGDSASTGDITFAQMTESTADGDSTTTQREEDTAGSTDTSTQASDSLKNMEIIQQDIAKQQIEMDEETQQELTAELLEENELDTSVIENERTTRGCIFDIPEGFEESEEVDNLYVTARYPLDTSMIYYAVMDRDTSLQLMTEELFKEQVEENLSLTYGEDIKINIDSFESIKINGYPAFRILCHYEVDNIKVTQLQYTINADKSYMITYSQTNDYDWMEAFEDSAATIEVK